MENAENTKDQLVEDLKEIRKKIIKLETVQIKSGKIKKELNQSYIDFRYYTTMLFDTSIN